MTNDNELTPEQIAYREKLLSIGTKTDRQDVHINASTVTMQSGS